MSTTPHAATMRAIRFAVLLMATSLLTGCIYSINPLYTEKDLVFMPELIGKWQDPKDKSTITFTKLDENAYFAVSNDDGKEQRCEARLVKLGELLMLDIYPDNAGSKLQEESLLPCTRSQK
jgi:hypothetical protein